MTERKKTVCGPDFEFNLFARGKSAAELKLKGSPRLLLGRVTLENKFSETGSLEKKLRRHESADLFSIGLESLNILPFGCEYAIARDFEVSDGFAEYANDISALHFGRVGNLELEPLTFTGDPQHVSFLLPGDDKWTEADLEEEKELYSGSRPLLMLSVRYADDSCVEYAVGTDLWRHCAAEQIPGATGEFTLTFDGENLIYERKMLIYDPDTEPEKRPWRFKNLLAWRTGETSSILETAEYFAAKGCQMAPVNRREVRKKVRSAKKDMILQEASPCICSESAHVERPGRKGFAHFDLAEYVSFRLWANKQLAKSGFHLVIDPAETSIFKNTAAMRNLRNIPGTLEPCMEEEEDV